MSERGYFGVALYQPKTEANLGTIMRSAHNFGAAFIATIGHRYRKQASDTTDAAKHVPVFHYPDLDSFRRSIPVNCDIVIVEVDGKTNLPDFTHHERAVYLFGGEDRTVPQLNWPLTMRRVRIDTPHCLNLAVTASVVMYDRHAKQT